MENVIIGLCGSGFPEVRRALEVTLPDAEIITVPVAAMPTPGPDIAIDVLVPLGETVDAAVMDATRPKLIQQFGVGIQGVDLAAARARGIPVASVPATDTGNAVAVAEIAILHVLALLRRYSQAQSSVRGGRLGQPCGSTLAGKTATVVGVGAVGTALIARLTAFEALPIGVGPRERTAYPAAALLPADCYHRVEDLSSALARSHIAFACCPLTDQTRGLIDERQLAAMPTGGYLINVARGPVVDYTALLNALRTGHLAGAGIDVAWDEPIDPGDALLRENVTVTPHIGGVTTESYSAMAQTFATNVHNLRTGQPIAHRAD